MHLWMFLGLCLLRLMKHPFFWYVAEFLRMFRQYDILWNQQNKKGSVIPKQELWGLPQVPVLLLDDNHNDYSSLPNFVELFTANNSKTTGQMVITVWIINRHITLWVQYWNPHLTTTPSYKDICQKPFHKIKLQTVRLWNTGLLAWPGKE